MALDEAEKKRLQKIASNVRCEILAMITHTGSGHPGGSLSAAEVVVALYFHKMRHKPDNPKWDGRDRFVLSKGHACPLAYACLAEAGYFPKSELQNLRKINSMLQGHPDMNKTPGIEASTGSLGQGLSIANGMALALRLDKKENRVYVLLGDGELQEGEVWEAAMFAAHNKLDNLTAIVDKNGLQIDGETKDIMNVEPIADKFKAFNWNVIEIDGHDFAQIINALEEAEKVKGKPTMIVADTVKGKDVSFMENVCDFHGKALNEEQLGKALKELEAKGSG